MMRLYPLLLFLCFFHACTFSDKKAVAPAATINAYDSYYRLTDEAETLLKDGDLLVRSGNDLTSQLIKNFSKKDNSFSHSGLVFFQGGTPLVYHIEAANGGSGLKADSLRTFCNPRGNTAFAIYRYQLDPEELSRLKAAVFEWKQQGVKFDSLFNMQTDDFMYCSEMIKKGLERTTNYRIRIPTVHPTKNEATLAATRLPLSAEAIRQLDIVPIDHLYVNPHSRLVKRFDFNPTK